MFDEYLPAGEKSKLLSEAAGGCDDTFERKAAKDLKLWRCSDSGGQLKVEEIAQKPLKKEMLDTNVRLSFQEEFLVFEYLLLLLVVA